MKARPCFLQGVLKHAAGGRTRASWRFPRREGRSNLNDVTADNKAKRHRHQHESADETRWGGRRYVEISATGADQETDDQSNERGSHGHRSLEGEATAAERSPKSARVFGSSGGSRDSSKCMSMHSTPGMSHCRGSMLVATIGTYRRPVRQGGRRWRSEVLELLIAMHDAPTDERQHRDGRFDLVLRHREVIAVERSEIGELARRDAAFLALLGREPGAAFGPQP